MSGGLCLAATGRSVRLAGAASSWPPARCAQVGLGWSAVLYGRFLVRRQGFAALERWQTAFLPVYAAWAWAVVLVFPPLFGFC